MNFVRADIASLNRKSLIFIADSLNYRLNLLSKTFKYLPWYFAPIDVIGSKFRRQIPTECSEKSFRKYL